MSSQTTRAVGAAEPKDIVHLGYIRRKLTSSAKTWALGSAEGEAAVQLGLLRGRPKAKLQRSWSRISRRVKSNEATKALRSAQTECYREAKVILAKG